MLERNQKINDARYTSLVDKQIAFEDKVEQIQEAKQIQHAQLQKQKEIHDINIAKVLSRKEKIEEVKRQKLLQKQHESEVSLHSHSFTKTFISNKEDERRRLKAVELSSSMEKQKLKENLIYINKKNRRFERCMKNLVRYTENKIMQRVLAARHKSNQLKLLEQQKEN